MDRGLNFSPKKVLQSQRKSFNQLQREISQDKLVPEGYSQLLDKAQQNQRSARKLEQHWESSQVVARDFSQTTLQPANLQKETFLKKPTVKLVKKNPYQTVTGPGPVKLAPIVDRNDPAIDFLMTNQASEGNGEKIF